MNVREMQMGVSHGCVPVHVAVLRTRLDGNIMFLLVTLVVGVLMISFQHFMRVRIFVLFS